MKDLPLSGAFADPTVPSERYVLLDRLGSGGMGVVWRARDTLLERDVALKTVGTRNDEFEERLAREVRVATRIASPGIVWVLDRGSLPDGRPFVVFELLDIPALGRGHDDLQLLVQAARAVGDAHRQGLVHRDLKPSNLGLRNDRLVVLDWGLAKPVDDSGWNQRVLGGPLTASGVTVGTLGYMAPEQIAGGRVDAACDVWALGALAYEICSGQDAWEDGTHALLSRVSSGTLVLPAGPLCDVVKQALSLDPRERHPDGHAFADALEQALGPPDVPASRRPLGLVLAAGVFLVGLSSGAAFLRPAAPPPDADARALHVELGHTLAAQGRFLEAREHGAAADRLGPGADSTGLLMLPHAAPPVVEEHPCDRVLLFDGRDRMLCDRPGRVTLYEDGRPTLTHDLQHERAWLGADGVVVHDGWTLHQLQDDGGRRVMDQAVNNPIHVAMGPEPAVVLGPKLWSFDAEVGTQVTSIDATWALHTPVGLLTHDAITDSVLLADGENGRRLFPLDEPVVYGAVRSTGVVIVGLRGTVVELDPESLEPIRRYQLRHVHQVFAAAWDGLRLAVSTPDGLFVSRKGEPELQLDVDPPTELGWLGDGRLRAAEGATTLTWDVDGAAALMVPERLSTTALRGSNSPSFALQDHLFVFDPDRLTWGRQGRDGVGRGPIRSLPQNLLTVDNDELFRLVDDTFVPIGPFPVAAPLRDGSVLATRRWGRGIALASQRQGLVKEYVDLPPIRTLVTDQDGDHALGLDDEGRLHSISRDGAIALVDEGPVLTMAASPLGRAVARPDGHVELLGRWHARCGDNLSSVAVGRDHVAAGTLAGGICLFDAEGELLARFPAHAERVSALAFWGDVLFSGSWAPGVRRWRLPTQSSATTSSSG